MTTPRVEGLDRLGAEAFADACTSALDRHADPETASNHPHYMARAEVRYALGNDVEEVVDDLQFASLCLRRAPAKWRDKALSRFRGRRLEPLETALAAGSRPLAVALGEDFGFSFDVLLAGLEEEAVVGDVKSVTSYFGSRTVVDARDLQGLALVLHAGMLTGLLRGDGKSVLLALEIFNEEVRPAREGGNGNLAWIDRAEMLAGACKAILLRRPRPLGEQLHALVGRERTDTKKRVDNGVRALIEQGHGSLDLAIPALVALARWRGVEPECDDAEAATTLEAWGRAQVRLSSG